MNDNQQMAKEWFFSLRNNLVDALEKIDGNKFDFKDWEHSGSGGGTMGSIRGKIVEKGGVKILGEANILNKLPVSASNLYAKNVFNFISNLYDKENKKLNINLEDEIIEKTLIK